MHQGKAFQHELSRRLIKEFERPLGGVGSYMAGQIVAFDPHPIGVFRTLNQYFTGRPLFNQMRMSDIFQVDLEVRPDAVMYPISPAARTVFGCPGRKGVSVFRKVVSGRGDGLGKGVFYLVAEVAEHLLRIWIRFHTGKYTTQRDMGQTSPIR